jgi:periplasmic divalent cation tolerance protein
LLIKSSSDRYPAIEQAIRELHSYDLPEIIALPIARGLPDYLNWIDACVAIK